MRNCLAGEAMQKAVPPATRGFKDMSPVENWFVEHNSFSRSEVYAGLADLVQVGNGGSPAPVRCIRRVYYSIVRHIDSVLSHHLYDDFCIILSALRYIAKGSPSPSTGFPRLLHFGLMKKITWCEVICLEKNCQGDEQSWTKAVDDFLFTLSTILAFSEEVKCSMVPLLPTLLKFVSIETLPGSARIEATRGSNCLLEVCSSKDKESLIRKDDTRALIEGIIVIVQNAGDFELQVTILECLFRLTTANERRLLSRRWFESSPAVLTAFNGIREGLFEVDCRKFLNLLNASCHDRRVFSIPCKKAFLGSFELYRPRDEGLDQFWVDFNIATGNLSLYVDEMDQGHGGGSGAQGGGKEVGGDDGLWESIIIRKDIVKEWSISTKNGDYCLTISLSMPSHTLLPTAPTTTSNVVFIAFGMESDPSQPLRLIFGSINQTKLHRPNSDVISSQISAITQRLYGKQSTAILPIHLNGTVKPKIMQDDEDVSPIEVLPNSQAIGECVNSQEHAVTPPNKSIVPTPVTSTPKLRTLTSASGLHSERKRAPVLHSSSGSKRFPLKFVSSGERRFPAQPKISQSVSSIALGKNCRVVQRSTLVNKPSPSGMRNTQAPLLSSSLAGNETRSKAASDLARSNYTHSTGTTDVPKNTKIGSITGRSVLDNSGSSMGKGSNNVYVCQATKTALTKAKKGKAETPTRPHTSPLPSPPPSSHSSPQPGKKSSRALSHKPKTSFTSTNHIKAQTEPLPTSSVNVPSSPKTADMPTAEDKRQKSSAMAPSHKPETKLASANHTKTQTGLLPTSLLNIPSSPKTSDICSQPSQSPPNRGVIGHSSESHLEMLASPPRSSPIVVTKKKLSSSFSSNLSIGSVKSRVVVNDIANACLNRGGQQRLFNLSALPKGRKCRRKQNANSACSSFSASTTSEYNLHAIPDSMPLDATQRNSRSTRNTKVGASKRKSKRAYTSRDHSLEEDVDKSWSGTPPKLKKRKTNHNGQANKVGSRVMLASARTKRGPNAKSKLHVASFDITNSDYEDVDTVRLTKHKFRRRDGKTKNNQSTIFDDQINHGRRKLGKEALKKATKDMLVWSPGNNPSYEVSRMERRMIDDVYDPQISPEPLPSSRTCELTRAKMLRQSKPHGNPKGAHDELPSAKRSRKGTGTAMQNAPSKKKLPSKKSLAVKDFDELKDSIGEEQSWSELHSYHKEVVDSVSCGTTSGKKNNPLATRKQPRRGGSYSSNYYEGYVSYSEETGNKTPKIPCGGATSFKSLDIQAEIQNEEVEIFPLPPSPSPPLPSTSFSPVSPPTPITDTTKASENIVQGFKDICLRLVAQSGIAQSGRRGTVHAQKSTTACTSIGVKPSRSKAELETSTRPKKDDSGGSPVTLTQLSRNIVKRHKVTMNTSLSPVKERLRQEPASRCTDDVYNPNSSSDSDIDSTHSEVDSPIGRTVHIVTTEPSITIEPSKVTSPSFATEVVSHHPSSPTYPSSPIAKEAYTSEDSQSEGHTLQDINTEMNTLMATLKENLTLARKIREQKRTSTSPRKVPEELKELWLNHKEERSSVLREYEHRIITKMNELEKDAKKSWSSEEKLNSSMKQYLKTLQNSRKLQQSQLQHLRTLQSSLCEQLTALEANHLEQQTTSHGSLENEMYNIHKKLLEESQKKELVRIKKSLEAMLMYV